MLYENGFGVAQDYCEAVKWYRLAAEQGYPTALSNLGGMYFWGRCVSQDHVEAHKWMNLAISRLPPGKDREDAARKRDIVAARMTPVQIAEAQKRARGAVQTGTASAPPTPVAATSNRPPAVTGCVVTIHNPLVALMSEPNWRSQERMRVIPGAYATLDYVLTEFARRKQGWFQIEADGRTGWIADDTWTIAAKSPPCP